jgi:CheY-like chemotaxis protein
MDRLQRDTFLEQLREALQHLYDPDQLRRSPLAAFFGLANRFDTSTAMRNVLVEAIDALKPKDDNPSQERAWRIYDSLYYGYVQRLNQQAVADQLGLSARQLRREKHAAIEVLADYLYQHHGRQSRTGETADYDLADETTAISQDLEWLQITPVTRPLDLGQALPDVIELVQTLATRHAVRLEVQLEGAWPFVVVHPVAFDQILLNLVSLAITRAASSLITLAIERRGWEALIRVHGDKDPATSQPVYEGRSKRLQIARQLLEMSKGTLEIADEERAFAVRLTLPCIDQLTVMAVDDNPDTLSLFQRYTLGTPYHLVTTRDPEQLLALAEKSPPHAIVLDVMMPDIDGWKLLGRLRQHPRLHRVPLIVCTILPQQELALSLGASALLKKPLTRAEFLAALDQQVALSESESR